MFESMSSHVRTLLALIVQTMSRDEIQHQSKVTLFVGPGTSSSAAPFLDPGNHHEAKCVHATLSREENRCRFNKFKIFKMASNRMIKAVRVPMTDKVREALVEWGGGGAGDMKQVFDGVCNQFFVLGYTGPDHGWRLDTIVTSKQNPKDLQIWPVWSSNAQVHKELSCCFSERQHLHQHNPTFPLARLFFRAMDGKTVVEMTEEWLVKTYGAFSPVVVKSQEAYWMCVCGY